MAGALPLGHGVIDGWFERADLGPARLLNLAVAFAFVFLLVDRGWKPLSRLCGSLLLPIGQHSLYVFLIHILVVQLSRAYLPAMAAELLAATWAPLAVDLVLIAILWTLVRRRVLFAFVPG